MTRTVPLTRAETETDRQRAIHFVHRDGVQMPHFFSQPLFVERPNLFQKNDRIPAQPVVRRIHAYVRRQIRLSEFWSYCGGNHGRTVLVSEVILNYQNRSNASLFRSDNGAQIRVVYVSAFDLRQFFPLSLCVLLHNYFCTLSFDLNISLLLYYVFFACYDSRNKEGDTVARCGIRWNWERQNVSRLKIHKEVMGCSVIIIAAGYLS